MFPIPAMFGILLLSGGLMAAVAFPIGRANADTIEVIYSFKGGSDGMWPQAGLIADTSGNLFSTTHFGGGAKYCTLGCGTVFEVTPAGEETILYAFKGGSDGYVPEAGLLADKKGDFYGTTVIGGAASEGTVFKLTANHEKQLVAFTGSNGKFPLGGLVADNKGNLFGTTIEGGSNCIGGCGIVFKLAPDGTETVRYSFCKRKNCADGEGPSAGLIADTSGNLYGTTANGGVNCTLQVPYGCGTVFKMTPAGKESVLYAFKGGSDGANPVAGLIADEEGNLYGTTENGGAGNAGTVFRISTNGTEAVLHSFCSLCQDGALPLAGLIEDKVGNLYGTTVEGGSGCGYLGCGTIFRISPSGTETVFHSFGGGYGGAFPYGGLTADGKGDLYGTTETGGADDFGTVFVLRIRGFAKARSVGSSPTWPHPPAYR